MKLWRLLRCTCNLFIIIVIVILYLHFFFLTHSLLPNFLLPLRLVDDTKHLVRSAGGTQEQLAEAAIKAVTTMQTGADQVKKGASLLTFDDVEPQVSFSILSFFIIFIVLIVVVIT